MASKDKAQAMNKSRGIFSILTQPQEVISFVGDVTAAADSDKASLGFYPDSVYLEYALKGNIFVAITELGKQRLYAGHVLFDLRQPRAKVLQVFVDPGHRRLGIAESLISELKIYLSNLQYLSIEARVAEDMTESNSFWERQNFNVQRLDDGGASRGKRRRKILVRNHELASPQLFGPSGIDVKNPLGFSFLSGTEKPIYLLDMNVLFDLGPRRHRRSDVANLFRAERMQACSLAISSEILEELKRNCPDGKTDPMQDFASILPTYSGPPDDELSELIADLAELVFPDRSQRNALTVNDTSDLKHLATAIFHRLNGLVSSDMSILRAAPSLRTQYGLDVLSPTAFSLQDTHSVDVTTFGSEQDRVLTLSAVEPHDESEARSLLSRSKIGHSQQLNEWAAVDLHGGPCRRFVVRSDGDVVGYITWHQKVGQTSIDALMAIDEKSPTATDCVRLMLSKLSEDVAHNQVVLVRLGFPAQQYQIRQEAISIGFTAGGNNQAQLHKIVLRSVVTQVNWEQTRASLMANCGVRLPSVAPAFRSINQHIEIHAADGNRTHLSLHGLESLLAPGLFCLPGRGGVITPVRRQFSEHLLRHLPQGSLLPQARVQLYQQRHYLSHPKNRTKFSTGQLIFFYESQNHGGLGALVAVGRVVRAYLQDRSVMGHSELDRSVFDIDQLDTIGRTETRTVTVFDNLNVLPAHVSGDTLREIGCGTPVKLLSTQTITSEQVERILARVYNS